MSITFRDMQNPDEPDLPFAQPMSITFRDMQNPDEPDLPFAQSSLSLSSLSKRQTYYDYTVKGDIAFPFGLGKIDGVKRLTESNANNYRRMGYSVVKVAGTGDILIPKPPRPTGNGTTSGGYPKSYIDEHFDRLYKIHKEQEGRITDAWEHRKSIEGKVEKNISAFPDIHTKLTNLGKSVTDVSDALNLHAVHPILPTIDIPPIPPIIPTSVLLIAVGVGAYFLLRRKRK